MAKITKLGSVFMSVSNPANMHILDLNVSIGIYNSAPNLQNLLALQAKVKRYEFAKLSVAMAIEIKQEMGREFDVFFLSNFVAATVNCRAGGRTLQISGGGGDDNGEGGGYKSWKECGFESVVQQDAINATKFEEVAQELSQKAVEGSLSPQLATFLNKTSALSLQVSAAPPTFIGWVRGFRGQGICAQKSSSDGKQWVGSIVREVPHLRPLGPRYTLELDAATRLGDKEYTDYMAAKLRMNQEASRNQLSTITMPEDWQTECFNYGESSGNWALQEFIRVNKDKPLPVVSKQFPLAIKAIDDYLLPQLAGMNWRTADTPDFRTAWGNKDKPNRFE